MKARILSFAIAFLSLTIAFTACKKDASTSGTTDTATQASNQSDDQNEFSGNVDAVANDANIVLETNSNFTGRVDGTQGLIINATVVFDTVSNPRTITITYNGTNDIGTHSRSGVVVISMAQGVHWRDAGAVVTVTYQNLKFTRLSDNKSITINGAHTYTNVSGGLLVNLATLGTITHTITSNGMTVTFDNGSQRSWQIARQRAFTYDNGVVITETGLHTEGNVTGISEWGTNRFGNAFTTAIVTPLVVKQSCDFRLTGGSVLHTTPAFTAAATFGLDASGNPTSCPGTGHYYMQIAWAGNGGNSHTILLPY